MARPQGKSRRFLLLAIASGIFMVALSSLVVVREIRRKSIENQRQNGGEKDDVNLDVDVDQDLQLDLDPEKDVKTILSRFLVCPPPGDPVNIDLTSHVIVYNSTNDAQQHQIILENSPQGILCTLLEVATEGNLKIKPIGRSYNGRGWEPYQGLHSSTNIVPLWCSDAGSSTCLIDLPTLEAGRKYILKSYEHSLGTRDEAARFLEKTTFGATSAEIDAFVAFGNNHSEWIKDQLELPTISSHRQFYRTRANNFHPETTWMGTLSFKPCEAGARYRKLVFMPKDIGRYLTIAPSPVDPNYKILMVGGQVRSVIPGGVNLYISAYNQPAVPDGSYQICYVDPETFTGHHVAISVESQCNGVIFAGVFGNPKVQLDKQHFSLVNHLVTIDGKAMPIMEDFFPRETEMLQLTTNVTSAGCMTEETTGAPEAVTFASYENEFWIHTPFFRLVDNQIETPLIDGGKSAVVETQNAPHERMKVVCANAPRTFLNEDGCVLSENACSSQGDVSTTLVCGSPYEVASIPDPDTGSLFRGSFDIYTFHNRTLPQYILNGQRETVWLEIALKGKDQLRQRMAWALSQILVVSPTGIGELRHTESFLTYYDIFVRNAFGNYFDILKEVTYSPLMAEMLTYRNGVSTGFEWIRSGVVHHADENYARELLQLFTIGLHVLNDDGTVETDANGHEVRTYTNEDISEFAKVFVGLKRRPKRGNIEDVNHPEANENQVDPLEVHAGLRDHFPKLGIQNQYIGDGYPLCKDIPPGDFLKKGATFRFLGSNPVSELLNEPKNWLGSDPVRISLDTSSVLSSVLCNKGSDGSCAPMMKVVLDSDIECFGVECSLQEPRTFELFEGSGLWYEYVRPPCVEHAFYEGAQSIRVQGGPHGHSMCGDPDTYAASTVCCEASGISRTRQELFAGERVSLDLARKRCSSLSPTHDLCQNSFPTTGDCDTNGGCDHRGSFYWSSSGCFMTAKINREGKVAVIHNPQIQDVDTYKMVAEDTEMFFRVDWVSDDAQSLIGDLISDCSRVGCTDGDGDSCICPIEIHEETAFHNEEDLHSIDYLLSTATIGAFVHDKENFYPVIGAIGVSKYPHGNISSETIFRIADSYGRIHFRKNTKNRVRIGNGAGEFRNPVTFYSLSEPTPRDASYEIDATLYQAFFHRNMAPFVSFRLAQRFGISNPSPRYIRSISRAFRSGLYVHSSSGMRIGSSQYGCLKATTAALLLDDEVLDTILDADPMHGSLLEPYLKIVKVLRALEFKASKSDPLLTVGLDLQLLIGQQSHKIPSVFSFFRPEYQPPGRVRSADMMSPESQVLSGPSSLQLMNILISFLKYGANDCYGGFGNNKLQPIECKIGATSHNGGNASYDPKQHNLVTAPDIVDDLSTLLTSGRLDGGKRDVIIEAFEATISRGKSVHEAIIDAQQLIIASPEFHSTNLGRSIGEERSSSALSEPTNIPYKAVILVILPGGYDSFNVLVPKECNITDLKGKTVRDQYLEQRGHVAFDEEAGEFDLDINAADSNQPCNRFAVHDELKIIKDLYDAGDLTFFANAGVINNGGMTKENYDEQTRTQLFAHNAMQLEVAKVDPYDQIGGTGIMGRAKDILSKNGHVVGTISIDNPSIAVDGMQDEESPPVTIVGRGGSKKFAVRPNDELDFDIEKYARTLNGKTDSFSGVFGETWSQRFMMGVDKAEEYESILDSPNLNDSIFIHDDVSKYTGTDELEQEHWEKWSSLLKLIQRKDLRNVDRDFFFTELGSWDTHEGMKDELRSQLSALNLGLEMFVKEAKSSGVWDEVAVVIASDFGRTLAPNNNNGTDHGWGGHYMIMGGDVKGGKILGEYPTDLTPGGLLVDGLGRFIPTTSWDSIWSGILEWTGVTEHTDLDYCLPNRLNTVDPVKGTGRRFPLLTADAMFLSLEESGRNLRGRKE